MTLSQIPLIMASRGSKVRLVSINGGKQMTSRLAAMGLLPGVEVEIISNTPGDPFILDVRGSRLALGRGMAHKIFVN
jgi:Fe2+ transport system protein FeoA